MYAGREGSMRAPGVDGRSGADTASSSRLMMRLAGRVPQLLPKARLGEDQPGLGVIEHVTHSQRRVSRINRYVGRARLQHGQERDDQLPSAIEVDGHALTRTRSELHEPHGEGFRKGSKLAVRQRPRPVDHGDRPRRLERAGGEALVNEAGRRRLSAGGPRLREHGGPLGGRQQGNSRDDRPRLDDDGVQHREKVLGEALDGGGVEQIDAVLEAGGLTELGVEHQEAHVELGRPARQGQRRELERRGLLEGCGGVLEVEHHLHEGRRARSTLDAQFGHQALEGEILVRVGIDGGLARALEHLKKRQLGLDPNSHGERVDERAGQPL